MSVKSDKWIKEMSEKFRMIEPFEEKQVSGSEISYGLSSYGYDIRLSDEFRILKTSAQVNKIIDPKNLDQNLFSSLKSRECVIPANSYILARSHEYFRIPRNILTICFGKSTYARCGVIVNVTPFEPEWEGYVTMGISNTSPFDVKIYASEGIAQVIFLESDEICRVSYKDRKGKYQSQKTITLAKVK